MPRSRSAIVDRAARIGTTTITPTIGDAAGPAPNRHAQASAPTAPPTEFGSLPVPDVPNPDVRPPAAYPSGSRRRGALLVLIAIMLIAVNLRVAVAGLGALLDQIATGLAMGPALPGVLTTLPTVAFAAVGAFTPRLHRLLGPAPLLGIAMALLGLGQLARAATSDTVVFLGSSAAALFGIAVGNVLLPVLIKQYFPGRIGLVTAGYTGTMTVGCTLAAAATVPLADAAGSWRIGLGVWAIPALLALPAVLAFRKPAPRGPVPRADDKASAESVKVARTRLGWAMAIFFGMQSFSAYALMGWLPQLYRDAGFSAQTAGLLLAGVIGAGGPMALIMPWLAARRADQRVLVVLLAVSMLVAYVGLMVAPRQGALVWTGLLAFGQGSFPLALALVGLRARTMAGTAALSGFAQSTGYLIAMAGPLSVGLLYRLTGGFLVPLAGMLVALVIQAIAGLRAARPGVIEDAFQSGNAG